MAPAKCIAEHHQLRHAAASNRNACGTGCSQRPSKVPPERANGSGLDLDEPGIAYMLRCLGDQQCREQFCKLGKIESRVRSGSRGCAIASLSDHGIDRKRDECARVLVPTLRQDHRPLCSDPEGVRALRSHKEAHASRAPLISKQLKARHIKRIDRHGRNRACGAHDNGSASAKLSHGAFDRNMTGCM
jgi:hypothetical protein